MNNSDSEQFLRTFFHREKNIISWEKITGGLLEASTLRRLNPWLEDVRNERFPVILPRVVKGSNDKVTWYAVADEERNYVELRELLDAHVGTSWSDFNRQRTMLDPNDPVEKALIERYGDSVYKFSSLSQSRIPEVFNGIERLRQQLANRPSRQLALLRPRGRILRDIRASLRRRDVPQTRLYLQELRDVGGIGHINELFIELRCLALEGDAKSLLDSTELRRVLDMPHPLVLAEEVMAVFYQQMLLKYEQEGDLAGQRRAFTDSLAKSVPRLFQVTQGINAPAAVKNTLLWLLSDTQSDPARLMEQAQQLVARMEGATDDDRLWISQLLAALPVVSAAALLSTTTDDLLARADEHPESVLEEVLLLPVGTRGVAIALQCAWVVGSAEAAVKAISYLQQLAQQQRDPLLAKPTFQRYYTALQLLLPATRTEHDTAGLNNWQDWLQEVVNNPQWQGAIEVVEQASHQWSATALQPDAFVTLLDKSNSKASMVLRDAIPVLLEWLDNNQTSASWQSVRLALLQQLVLDDNSSREDVFIACDLARGYLAGDSNANDYRELIEYLQEMIETSGTSSASAWLDILELFLIYPTADQPARERLFNLVFSKFYSNPARYSELQWNLLAQFAEEGDLICEVPSQIAKDGEENADEVCVGTTLNHKVVGIYTLTDSVAQRVKKQLLADYPQADIRLNNDKGGSTMLRSLAKEADVFIFAWLSSKHSAYYAIKEERGEKPFLQPSGKGSTSMLDCIRSYLKG
ncbi:MULTISPECIES: protein DpdD [unclassified Serratia (in: enterobacteria)]|uniref:protein DpdD n=1 Tax=unclassified Serratia (in: enterobacteria) TaxID=2647522 RepID=UPI000467F7F2|nr:MULTISPECIES: protein DpdD [unclassified Serratia (in: enterobacteria)]